MDLLLKLMNWTWDLFVQTNFDVTFQGVTYNITLLAILLFTTFVIVAAKVLFSLFE